MILKKILNYITNTVIDLFNLVKSMLDKKAIKTTKCGNNNESVTNPFLCCLRNFIQKLYQKFSI